jgi:PPOX class probable F420-dependent enzyme
MEVRMTAASAGYFTPVATATYIRLTTFRRDGRSVATPVHVVVTADGTKAYFRTWDVTGKAKRIRHTAAVEIAPATFRGRPLGPASRPAHGCWTALSPSKPPPCSRPGTRYCRGG